jgi:hypothetical protein
MVLRNIVRATVLALWACTVRPANSGESVAVEYSTRIVLFVGPDTLEARRLHQRLGDDFYVTADDAMWYRAAAYELLDSMKIPYLEVRRDSARFVVDGKPQLVTWAGVDRAWFAIVYDGTTEPTIVADVDLRDAISPFVDGPVR